MGIETLNNHKMNTSVTNISLQGHPYNLGVDTALSIGYNTKGKYCITKGVISLHHDGRFVFTTQGIGVLISDSTLSEFYPDTKEGRKALNEKIKNNN